MWAYVIQMYLGLLTLSLFGLMRYIFGKISFSQLNWKFVDNVRCIVSYTLTWNYGRSFESNSYCGIRKIGCLPRGGRHCTWWYCLFCGGAFQSCCNNSLLSYVHSSVHKYTYMILHPSFVSFLFLTYSAHLVQY